MTNQLPTNQPKISNKLVVQGHTLFYALCHRAVGTYKVTGHWEGLSHDDVGEIEKFLSQARAEWVREVRKEIEERRDAWKNLEEMTRMI